MNWIEQSIYNRVKRYPALKLFIRDVYQRLFDLLPTPMNIYPGDMTWEEGYFYGFHDTTPFSFDNKKILANKLLISLRKPTCGDALAVGYFDFDGNKLLNYHEIGKSYAWNYHKGCRLQWIDECRIIYNTYQDQKICSKIYNVSNNKESIINFPIDTVSPKGNIATSFSYERLEQYMPGYGYHCKDDHSYREKLSPPKTGLFTIDLETSQIKLIVSLERLAKDVEEQTSSHNAHHYVTHTEFSGDGRYISFMHRWVGSETRLRWTRLLIYDLLEESYFELPIINMASHYVWRGNNLLAYCRIDEIDSQVIFDIPSCKYKRIMPDILNSDGHQTFISDDCFITDTYPNNRRMSNLYKVNISDSTIERIVSIYHPQEFKSTKACHKCCDFHPCASRDGKFVCFDAIMNKQRSLCVINQHNK